MRQHVPLKRVLQLFLIQKLILFTSLEERILVNILNLVTLALQQGMHLILKMEYGHRTTIHQVMGNFLHQEFISPLYLVWGNDFLVNSAYNPLIAPNSRHVILYGGQNDNGGMLSP